MRRRRRRRRGQHAVPAPGAGSRGRHRAAGGARCVAAGARLLFKKIDSRLRGNVGAEASAVAEALGADAPRRRTRRAGAGPVVAGGTIRGAGVAAEGIDSAPGSGRCRFRVEIPDSRSEAELDAIAAACLASAGRRVAVGAHGLAAALARQMARTARGGSGFVPEPPVLVVVGSQDPATAAQVAALAAEPASRTVIIEAVGGLLPPPPEAAGSTDDRPPFCAGRRSDAGDGGGSASPRAGRVVSALRPRTLVATGGDTAAASSSTSAAACSRSAARSHPASRGRGCRTGRCWSPSRAASVARPPLWTFRLFLRPKRQAKMRPELILPDRIMPSVEAALDRDYTVHRIAGRDDIGRDPRSGAVTVRAIAVRAAVGVVAGAGRGAAGAGNHRGLRRRHGQGRPGARGGRAACG